jgi:CarD family transcriptional regulator
MKTNAKKAIATKSKAPVKKTAVKTAVKASVKSFAKASVKAPVKTASKAAPKSAAKSVTKAPAKKTVAKLVKAKPPVSSKVSSAVAKKSKMKTPVKSSKADPKPQKKVAKVSLKPAKAVKVQAKTAVKTPVKIAVKKVVKKAVPAPTKAAVKVAVTSRAPVKTPVVKALKTLKPSEKPDVKAIIVKMPENQNAPLKTEIRASVIATARPPQMAVAKTTGQGDSLNIGQSTRPVYRPIQVIHKPLAPVQPARQMAPVAKESEKVEFKKGDYVVYPAHGVGEIEAVEIQIIGGMEIKLYAIAFEKDRMRLKVPVFKAHASGLRRLSTSNRMDDALKTLQGRAQIRRAMWSRRAQEYETKINSGDPVAIAEVLRDLKRSNDESEQSYSERQIYQSALERLAREVAAVERITEIEAAERLENMIKSKRSRAASASVEDDLKDVVNA